MQLGVAGSSKVQPDAAGCSWEWPSAAGCGQVWSGGAFLMKAMATATEEKRTEIRQKEKIFQNFMNN
jgi:hypothetical protein